MRNVRPSFIRFRTDTNPTKGTGPRSRSGELSAEFLARIDGSAVPLLSVDAIAAADGSSVLWRVTDSRSGRVLLEERIAQ